MKRFALMMLLSTACVASTLAQDPLAAYPNNYKLILDNPDISVIRVHYGPHEKIGVHDHSKFPTIYVYLNDAGPVRFTHDEVPPFVMNRPPVTQGSFRISPGRIERHIVENLSEQSSDYLRIELKKLPLHGTLKPIRSATPTPLNPGTTEEFSSPELTIHRIVCNPGTTCPASATKASALLVAFSPVTLALAHGPTFQMQSGEIHWLPSPDALSISPSSATPAHLLQIELHTPAAKARSGI